MPQLAATLPPAVLVVDDDPDVRESLVEELSDYYAVTTADSAEAALRILDAQPFDAVISDVRMPGLDGVELLRRVGMSASEIVRILLTGFADDRVSQMARETDGVYKVGKPWGEELEIILRRALESRYERQRAKVTLASEQRARVQAESTVARLDKLALLGTLMANVGHEMRAPLTYLSSNLTWLQAMLPKLQTALKAHGIDPTPEEVAKLLDEMRSATSECTTGTNRLAEIVSGLRAYSSPTREVGIPVDLGRCVTQSIQLVVGARSHGPVRVQTSIEENLPSLIGQVGELGQIIINLVVNAMDAVGPRGNVWVKAYRQGNKLLVDVEDDGPGIPTAVAERLFEPFFTTKPIERGTGLGLSISRGIARRYHGDLSFRARQGGGTVFTLELPVNVKESPT